MYFYSDGINDWTIQYGNSSGDVTVPQQVYENPGNYTVERITIQPSTEIVIPANPYGGQSSDGTGIVWPPQEQNQWVEDQTEQWVDDQGQWVDGYREWAERQQQFQDGQSILGLIDSLLEAMPKKGEQLEFDFVRQMRI